VERIAAVVAGLALLIVPAAVGAASEQPVAVALDSYLPVRAVGGELVVTTTLRNTSAAGARVRLEIMLPDTTSLFWTSTKQLICGFESDSSTLAAYVVCHAIDNELAPGEDAWVSLRARVLAPGPQRSRVWLTAGTARQEAEAEAIVPGCTITGTDGTDVLVGTPGRDVICALAGDDVVHGRGGVDRVWGGAGEDVLSAGPGDSGRDQLDGAGGNDVLTGGLHEDLVVGGDGNDALRGGAAGVSDESVSGGMTIDVLYGGGGADVLRGSVGIDQFYAGPGGDVVLARDGLADFVGCGSGSDRADVDDHDVRRNCERVTERRAR
jgi:Ca2+-binding RTX toxin-like protein